MSLTLPTTFSCHWSYHLVTHLASVSAACHAPRSPFFVWQEKGKGHSTKERLWSCASEVYEVNIHLLFYCLIYWCSCKSLKLLSKLLLKIYIQIVQRQCTECKLQCCAHWETRYVLTMVVLSRALTLINQLSEHFLCQSTLPGSSFPVKHFPRLRGNVKLFRKLFFSII